MPSPPLYFELIAFGIGLLLGSFLNVCISRLPAHESIVKPRSHCTACGHPVRWYDNIPLLSWIVLRARCRDCKAAISWRYPLVELAMALWIVILSGGQNGEERIILPEFDNLYMKLICTVTMTAGSVLLMAKIFHH